MNSSDSKSKSKLILAKSLNFSEKKIELIEIFVKEILNYNKKYNLISKSTEQDIWNRHVLDSAQLVKYIDHKNFGSLSDLGTGAGFPGIILSIFYNDIITFHVKLYDKSRVKAKFIKYIIDKIKLKSTDIYDNDYQSHILNTEYFVCRAFKKLPEILRISRETIKKPHKLIVMLGKSAQEEINKASKGLIYKYKLVNSITNSDSKILLVDVKK
ncbi:MAG: 16S rRNA (guanine(527)-N(7))-methyltransferase RsmG [Candidatus Pelagibacter sp. TMED196]|nr:MAG: 16S rRNA (guanine(527)-N(7))-methyltransferase RsmG [Candidatus Pelagibacter sp. TMED196]